jgi:hypothetical protein
MDDDEAALFAEAVTACCLDLDIAEARPRDLAFEGFVNRDRVAGSAPGVRANTDRDDVRRALLDDLLLESIEALVRAQLREFQR